MTSLKLLPEDLSDVPPHLADRYEAQAGRYWDMFYRRNTTKFFKDRHYLHKEFPALAAGPATLLEVGCGVGNTVFPLLEVNPQLRIHCCDFAPAAIDLVRQHPQYGSGAVHAFVADITADLLAALPAEGGCGVPASGCDFVTMVFVLSAIHPQRMAAAIHNVAACLRPGTGRLLFRDYAEGDLAQERLAGADRPKRLAPNFYLRGDGTRCYYYSPLEVVALFASAGLRLDSVRMHERTVVNRKRDISMDRRWLQATFTLREPLPPPLPLPVLLKQPHPQHAGGVGAQPPQAWQLAEHQQRYAAHVQRLVQQQHYQQQDDERLQSHGDEAAPRACGDGGDGMDADAAAGEGEGGSPDAAAPFPLPPPLPPAPDALSGLSGNWLAGAAGRLASHLAAGPGLPSGRALLPDSLDPADDVRAALSPSRSPASASASAAWPIPGSEHADGGGERGGGAWRHVPFAHSPLQHPPHHHWQPRSPRAAPRGRASEGAGDDMDVDGGEEGHAAGPGPGSEQSAAEADRLRHKRRSPLLQPRAPHSPHARPVHGGDPGSLAGGASPPGGFAAAGGGVGHVRQGLESQLEAEFFATIGRDAEEVVAEEVAAAGAALSCVRLVDPAEQPAAAQQLAAAAAAAAAAPPPRPREPHGAHASALPPARQAPPAAAAQVVAEVAVAVAAGVVFRCLLAGPAPAPQPRPAALALARIFLASPRALAGRCALQLGPVSAPHPHEQQNQQQQQAQQQHHRHHQHRSPTIGGTLDGGALPALAAVRSSAKRVVVSEPAREPLAAAAADLRRNAAHVVIERVRMAQLDWASASGGAGAGAARAPLSGAAGYTYVAAGAARQVRDLLAVQPGGFDVVYAAEPLAALTEAPAAAAAAAAASAAAVAAARGLFDAAAQLMHPGRSSSGGGGCSVRAEGDGACAHGGAPGQRLLLVCTRGEWAAAHGMGFAALAAVCGWELLEPAQAAALHGLDLGPAAAAGCAAMAFRLRAAAAT